MQVKIKNILFSMLFLLGLVVLLVLSSLFFQPKDNRISYGMEDATANGILGEPEQTIDVLFLGDSVSYCSVMPMQIWRDYGITSYVCGTPLQKLYYSREFLEKTFAAQSPKVVFLESTPMFYEYEKKDEVKNKIEQILPVVRYHDRWKDFGTMLELDTSMDVDYTYQDMAKGYRYFDTVVSINVNGYAYQTKEVAPLPEVNRKQILEIKEFCEKHGAELVFMSLPNAMGGWSPSRHNAVALLAAELGVDYFDMNYLQEEVPIDWMTDSFDDGDHMNYYGAQKVTAYLGQYLAAKSIFEDKRSNEAYAGWNETQKRFYDFVGE